VTSSLSWCLWRLRYKLSLRDLVEMFLIRGFVFSYEAVRDWEAKLTPALADELRRRRRGKAGPQLVRRRDIHPSAWPLEVSVSRD
jgi:transposase-like protein